MSNTICPKGHQSAESDFCSECGTKIQGAAVAPPAAREACPDCTAPRNAADFCEVCGYNYKTGVHGEIPHTAIPVQPPVPVSTAWELTVTIDESLRAEDSPPAPAGFAAVSLPLKPGASLIGRSSEKRAIKPEVSLDHDDAVSHRHALLDFRADNKLFLRDIESSNGTRINGQDAKPLEDIELRDGDRIELGHWTRISVKAI